MNLKLRPYQNDIINKIRSQLRIGHTRIVMQAATGSGKTVMFSYIVKSASSRGSRCMVLTDRIELLEQAGGTFDKIGIDYENITAQTKSIPTGKVMVAMSETIKRRTKSRLDFQILMQSVDILIVDEAHKNSFNDIFTYLRDTCVVIGCTATPIRAGQKTPLCDYYTALVEGVPISTLIKQGYLSKPTYYGVSVDLSNIRMKSGDYDEKQQEQLYSGAVVFSGLRENLARHAKGKKTMIFCPSVASSKMVAAELNCLHVDGTMSPVERSSVLTEFENTPSAIITNCAITTTGYDCPTIECIVLYRATTSLPLYLQMIGRGSRTTDTKHEFTILDFGMNVQRFGYWHIERQWKLTPDKKRKSKQDVFPIKFCLECGAILSVNTKICEYCGYEYPITEKERVFAELEKLSYSEVQSNMKTATVEEMEQMRIAKGYKIGFILHKFDTLSQFEEYGKLKGYNPKWASIQAKIYNVL